MDADAGGHDRGDGKFPDCVDNPGIPTFTEGPSTVMTFEDEDKEGFEEEGGGATPLPKKPHDHRQNVPKHDNLNGV